MPRLALSGKFFIANSPTPKSRNENESDTLRRLSHLNIQQKGLRSLVRADAHLVWWRYGVANLEPTLTVSAALQDGVGSCSNLRTLYAYDNELDDMTPELVMLPRLSHLYLQNNAISLISSLDKASNLQKL